MGRLAACSEALRGGHERLSLSQLSHSVPNALFEPVSQDPSLIRLVGGTTPDDRLKPSTVEDCLIANSSGRLGVEAELGGPIEPH